MPNNIINATSTGSGGLITTAADSGSLELQSDGTTIATLSSTGLTMAAGKKVFSEGSVLQVVSTQITAKTTVSVTTAGTFYDISGFSVSITPTNANSKIMFLAMVNQSSQTTGANRQYLRIVRGSTAIGIGDVAGSQYRTTTAFFINDGNAIGTLPLIWLDSPNTTSSTTYKIQVTSNGGSQTACFNRTSGDSQNDSAVTASQILVLEIAA